MQGHRRFNGSEALSLCTQLRWEGLRTMSYLSNVMDGWPLLRTAAVVILVFCCAAPFVLLFSSLVAYGTHSFIHHLH
jgi:hypothetical protein